MVCECVTLERHYNYLQSPFFANKVKRLPMVVVTFWVEMFCGAEFVTAKLV